MNDREADDAATHATSPIGAVAAPNPRRPSRSRDDRPSTGPSTVGIRVKSYGVKPAAADTGPTVTSSVAVCAENLLTNGPVSARGLTGRWTTPVMGTLLPATILGSSRPRTQPRRGGQVAACSAFGPAVGPASTNRIGRVLRGLVGWCRRAGIGLPSSSMWVRSTHLSFS